MSAMTTDEARPVRYQNATYRSGAPRLSRAKGPILPVINQAQVTAEGAAVAARVITKATARRPDTTQATAAAAAKVLANAEATHQTAWERRQELYLSLTLHNNVRGLADLAGISQQAGNNARAKAIGRPLPQMGGEAARRRALAAGIEPVRDVDEAVREFGETCVTVLRAAASRDYARNARDLAVRLLADAGVTQNEIGDLIGRQRSRVSHIVNRKG